MTNKRTNDNSIKKQYPEDLGKRILMLTSWVMLILGLSFSLIGLLFYTRTMQERDGEMIENMISLVEDEVDVDDLETCIDTGVMSVKYETLRLYMKDMAGHFGVRYFNIFLPLNTNETNNTLIVCGACNGLSEERIAALGIDEDARMCLSGSFTSAEMAAETLELFGKDREIHFLNNRNRKLGNTYAGVKTLYDSKGSPVAMIGVYFSIGLILRRGFVFLLFMVISTDTLVVLFQIFMYKKMQRTIIEPLGRLDRSAKAFAAKNNEMPDPSELIFIDPDIHTHDEIEELADTMKQMAEDTRTYITNLIAATSEQERINAELAGASMIQEDMLPRVFPCLPGAENVELYADTKPARVVGGDFYDYFLIDENHMGIVIADVSGKGVSASLFMVVAKTLIKSQALAHSSPADVLMSVNDQLCENNTTDMFVTVWFGIMDLGTGVITAVNAGHEYPMIRKPGEDYVLLKDRHGLAVSAMEGVRYTEYTIAMQPGESLFLYTDGVPEAANAAGEMFGTGKLIEVLNGSDQDVTDPARRISIVTREVSRFVRDAEQFDDMTMFCLVYRGPKK